MIALWIVLGVLALLCALLFLDVALVIIYDETMKLRFFVLGIPLNLKKIMEKERKPRRKKKKKRKKDEIPEKKPPEKRTLEEFFSFLEILSGAVREAGKTLQKHLRIRLNSFSLVVASQDAAQTAMIFGTANAAFYSFYAVLKAFSRFSVRDDKVSIVADYVGSAWQCKMRLTMRIKPVFLLSAFLHGFRGFVSPERSENMQDKVKNTPNTRQEYTQQKGKKK